jgi:hypothetical protein
MNIITSNNVTAHCGEVDPCVAIWALQYVSLYCLIFEPKCEAMKDIFGFFLTNIESIQYGVLQLIYVVTGGI